MSRHLFFFMALIIGCSSPKDERHDINKFLTLWAKAFSLKDNMVREFYDPAFEFPSVLVEDEANLTYTLDLERIEINT